MPLFNAEFRLSNYRAESYLSENKDPPPTPKADVQESKKESQRTV